LFADKFGRGDQLLVFTVSSQECSVNQYTGSATMIADLIEEFLTQ
jgi:hypothetical protein